MSQRQLALFFLLLAISMATNLGCGPAGGTTTAAGTGEATEPVGDNLDPGDTEANSEPPATDSNAPKTGDTTGDSGDSVVETKANAIPDQPNGATANSGSDNGGSDAGGTETKPDKGTTASAGGTNSDTKKPADSATPPKTAGADPRRSGRLFRGGKPGEVINISFDDLNLGMQADAVFRPFMLSDRAKELEGQRVRISGFILAGDRITGIDEFVLLRNTECKFGPGGQADHLLRIFMKDGLKADYQTKPISIEGVLKLNPFPDPRQTWSVFDLEKAEKIETVRR